MLSLTYSSPREPTSLSQSLSPQSQLLAPLGAGRNFHLHRSVQRRNIDRRTKSSLPGRSRQLNLNIVAADSLEYRMWLNPNVKQNIPGGRAVRAWLTLACQANDRAVADSLISVRRPLEARALGWMPRFTPMSGLSALSIRISFL